MTYRMHPFAGLIIRPVVTNSVSRFGNVFRVRTLTNVAALKHLGGPNFPAANDKGPTQLTTPLRSA